LIKVLPASDKKTFREFLHFPFKLYDKNSSWVPPLIKDIRDKFSLKNPFLHHGEVMPFIAKRNGETVGRVTAIHNQAHVDFHGEKTGFFGFFDCINENDVAKTLMGRVVEWVKDKGMTEIRGPMNFSSNEEWGLLIHGFDDPPMVMMPYQFPYYRKLYEHCGLEKARDLYAYIADVPEILPEKVYRVAEIAKKRGIRARPVNTRKFNDEMKIFMNIYNSALEKNWGFIPMTEEEIDHASRQLKPIIVPELTLIAEHNDEPVGFMMFLPDYNYVLKKMKGRLYPFGIFKALLHSRNIRDARLLLLGVKQGFRRRGIDSLLFIEGLKGLKKKGFRRMEFSWILEDNYPVQRIIETMKGRLYKKYRVYECSI
jgi:GNAT superfamily N-acetyltransferase